jgi:hypothetical protein
MLGLLITVNPDLHAERTAIVTPVVRWCACWVMPECEARWRLALSACVLFAALFVLGWVCFSLSTDVKEIEAEEAVAAEHVKEEEDKEGS